MRKLALSDEILMKVDKPARYIGNEFNSVMKDTSQVNIRFAMCFPDVYEIGMSHLGIQILYDMFNRMDDVWCERVYSPWPDLHEIMKQENIPLFGLESQESIKDFDFVAMTLQYEMCYTNILQILDLAQIPLRSRDREDGCPIVIAGGPCTYNPEPIADFFDIFYIGEGETQYGNLFELYKKAKADGLSREEFLHEAAKIEGCTAWECFWKITLPMVSSLILVNVIYTIIDYFCRSDNEVMDYISSAMISKMQYDLSAAMAWIYFVCCLVIIGIISLILSKKVYYYE